MFGFTKSQRKITNLNLSNSNIMDAAYRASQIGTAASATAATYGYQTPLTRGMYSMGNTGSVSNVANETTGYINEIYHNQPTPNISNVTRTGLYNASQNQFSGSYQNNPAVHQINSMTAYQGNLAYQGSSIDYQQNSMGYQRNVMGYQTNLLGYPTSYSQSGAVGNPAMFQYRNSNYYNTSTPPPYPNRPSTSGFQKKLNWQKKGSKNNTTQKKASPKSLQLHYCDVCKISCTGTNTYREHLEGQQHKKKEIVSKNEVSESSTNQGKHLIQCKICNITCSGNDAYYSHIQGAKHQKVILLHKKLGKEIPAEETASNNGTKCSDGKDGKEEVQVVQPVGQDYIEEIKNEMGLLVNIKCKLCDCEFSDKNAKNTHMKGRRHRLQYKKKVDSNLVVDVKPSIRKKQMQDKILPQPIRNCYPHFQNPEVPISRCYKSRNDYYVMTKYFEIHPKENEIETILRVVLHTEKALKFISDELFELKSKEDNNPIAFDQNDKAKNFTSLIQGVWRVNHLAKSLLLHKEKTAELVVMCSEKPTFTFLRKIVELLPEAFKKVTTQHTYSVLINTTEAGFIVSGNDITVLVHLTNSTLLEECIKVEPNQDNLASEKCTRALMFFKQTKWFYNTVTHLPHCSKIILVLRDLCEKVPTLMPLNCWILELLVERVVASIPTTINVYPEDVFRRVMESISSGILLSGGPGLIDPCEEKGANAIDFLTAQQREDITAFAQNALRLIAFEKIHEVLLIDPLPEQNYSNQKLVGQKRVSCEESENCNEKKIKLTSDDQTNIMEVTQ